MANPLHCLVCGRRFAKSGFSTSGVLEVLQCVNCGLGRTVKAEVNSGQDDIYGEKYFTGQDNDGHDFSGDFMLRYDRVRFSAELDEIERLSSRGKILDVGCATGSFLFYAQKRGWRVYGYDISEYAAGRAAEGVKNAVIASGRLDTETFSGELFDVITLHHVLEHVGDPHTFLETGILPLLKTNGLVLIEVPNFNSLEARVLKSEWEDLRPEQHVWHFTPESLRMLLEKHGITHLSIYTLHNPIWRARMFVDYIWMIASRLLQIPYEGKVGRRTEGRVRNSLSPSDHHRVTNGHQVLVTAMKWAGQPLLSLLNLKMMGKRLVLTGRKERASR